jgi:2-dehydro-3-deoxygluconokinase
MARLSPPGNLRLRQAMPGTLEVTFAGAEVNVAAAIASLGGPAEFVTALPRNEIADACLAALRGAGVGIDRVIRRDDGRFGLYFFEAGANQRVGNVVYDRENSAFALTPGSAYPWPKLFAGAGWFHTTGISPGVSRVAAEATLAGTRAARAAGLMVSCDLNFRRKLWRWDPQVEPAELARQTFGQLMPAVDLVVGGAADIALAAGLKWTATSGLGFDRGATTALAREYVRRFPQTKWVAMTLREGCSASHSRWGAFLYEAADDATFLAPTDNSAYAPFDISAIVDPLGTGDAFAAALIFALQTPELAEPSRALHFATAASCLAHSIKGDFNFCARSEVEALMAGSNGSRLGR